jgi:uncharacterized membrane protein YadS
MIVYPKFSSTIVAYKKKKASKANSKVNYSFKKIFPWFIIWSLIASLLNTLGVFSGAVAVVSIVV